MELSAAEKRGQEMMFIPMCDLPPLAVKFAKHMGKEFGLCGEVFLTTWIVYAQCVEKLECTNEFYIPLAKNIQWFKDND